MNDDFELFLEKYCKKHKLTPEEAKTHLLVRDVEAYYEEKHGGDILKGE